MSNVFKFPVKRIATTGEKLEMAKKLLVIATHYIQVAQDEGVYYGWDNDGQELINFIVEVHEKI